MMLCLHLFNRDHTNLFQPLIFIGSKPLSYYISLFSDACVPIFAFVSGYGLYFKYSKSKETYNKENHSRIKKLYTNYWIILIMFAVILGWVLNKEGYPGSFLKFLENFSGINPSYNGAWWFFTTYILFVLTSKFWFSLLEKINLNLFLLLLGVVYVISFYFRIYQPNLMGEGFPILNYFQNQLVLYFCTLFQFMLGAFFLKGNWNKHFQSLIPKGINFNLFGLLGIIFLILLHGLIPNFIIAPLTGLGFIFIFLNLKLPIFINKILEFFHPHSTNLWLIHMFIYMIYFPQFIYGFKYPIIIFGVLVIICLFCSYIVNGIHKKIIQCLKLL